MEETYVFSFEEAIGQIYLDIGDDDELEDLLHSIILSDINDLIEDSNGFYEDCLRWEYLTEEEMNLLEYVIRIDRKL